MKFLYFFILFISIIITSCIQHKDDLLECEPGYIGESCSECAENYIKQSKYCIYDCSNIENVKSVNDTNDACICNEGYSFDKDNRICNKLTLCDTDRDCEIGKICKNNICEIGCHTDRNCKSNQVCNLTTQKCENKPCELSSDCGPGKICLNSQCVIGCEVNLDCESDEICNTETNKCEKNNNSDCRIENNCEQGYKCDDITGECKKIEDCRLENACEQGYICNQLNGNCELNTNCNTDKDCLSEKKCNNHSCVDRTPCVVENNNSECENGEICRADGYCGIDTGCDSDQYCIDKNPNKPACNTNNGICYECITNEYCTNLDKPICNTTTHICETEEEPNTECMIDSDCGLNRKCNKTVSPHECIDMVSDCNSDNDCQNGTHCNTYNGRCVMCLDDSQCSEPNFSCNLDTNICENPNNGGDNNGLCNDTNGQLTCILMGGTCDSNGNCDVSSPSDPCEGVSCPANSTCNNGSCECNTGYHESGNECIENETCAGVSCPSNSHCELNNNETGCFCNDNYTAKDTDGDGQKDTCVADN